MEEAKDVKEKNTEPKYEYSAPQDSLILRIKYQNKSFKNYVPKIIIDSNINLINNKCFTSSFLSLVFNYIKKSLHYSRLFISHNFLFELYNHCNVCRLLC